MGCLLRGIDRRSTEYVAAKNWHGVRNEQLHPGPHDRAEDVLEYVKRAEARTPDLDLILNDIGTSLKFPIDVIPACVKPEESALRKMWDKHASSSGKADRITDILRASISVRPGPSSITKLEVAIQTLANHEKCIAYKNQFFSPNKETGFRSFKAVMDVKGFPAEIMLTYAGMSFADKLTYSLRHFERSLRELESTAQVRCGSKTTPSDRSVMKLVNNTGAMMEEIRTIRKTVNDTFAEENGLNVLLDPKLKDSQQPCALSDLMRTFVKAVETNPLGKGLAPTMEMLRQRVLGGTTPQKSPS